MWHLLPTQGSLPSPEQSTPIYLDSCLALTFPSLSQPLYHQITSYLNPGTSQDGF